MSTISTHVLDTSVGRPAGGIPVRLEQAGRVLGAVHTDADGRARGLVAEGPGVYQLRFAVEEYFQQAGGEAFYSEIVIQFDLTGDTPHYHIPLLLSRYGYTTYRGT